jgi:pyridoxine 5-phosphate synthase
MARLSVNINKIATLRNARGGNIPDVVLAAKRIESFGAQGITVHPRPDERHIRYDDVLQLKEVITTELNVEGNPVKSFMDLVTTVKPHQVTLVPDTVDQLTSDSGWDTVKHHEFLKEVIGELNRYGIRSSIFVDPVPEQIENALKTGVDRIELYTESYASNYDENAEKAIARYKESADVAARSGLGINAGHDLSLNNIEYFAENIPQLDEVSIGHALIAESLYEGLSKVISQYLNKLK